MQNERRGEKKKDGALWVSIAGKSFDQILQLVC